LKPLIAFLNGWHKDMIKEQQAARLSKITLYWPRNLPWQATVSEGFLYGWHLPVGKHQDDKKLVVAGLANAVTSEVLQTIQQEMLQECAAAGCYLQVRAFFA
jgi:hypothetical protein